MPAVPCAAPRSSIDHRREPERTLLYRTVQTPLATGRARQDDGTGETAPAATERAFRRDLECGILAHGFARARCADCGHDCRIAYSCQGRGIGPSCTTRRRVETAAHRAEHVIARLPVRQWVRAVPKRLRDHLEHDPAVLNAALHIFLHAIAQPLRQCSPGAGAASPLGAVVFIHRCGALLNAHLHCHCIVIDGVFDAAVGGGVTFHPATGLDEPALGAVQAAVRRRLLRVMTRRGLLPPEDAQAMAAWEHGGGFLVNAAVRIEAHDRDGLERLLRYCARPAVARERLREIDPGQLAYTSVKPGPGGSRSLLLTPLELLDRLAALIPPPRQHRHRYYGVLAPNLPLPPRIRGSRQQPR